MADARLEIEEAIARSSDLDAPAREQRNRLGATLWTVIFLLASALLAALAMWRPWQEGVRPLTAPDG